MKQRRIDLDVMRIIACFLVIFNHLSGYGLYGNTDTALKSWIYMFPTMITRINVPLFFMISGTLLLTDRQEMYKKIITKRFLRIAYVLLIFTAVLYFTALGNTFMGWNFNDYFRAVLAEPQVYGGGCLLVSVLLSWIPFASSTSSKDSKRNDEARLYSASHDSFHFQLSDAGD